MEIIRRSIWHVLAMAALVQGCAFDDTYFTASTVTKASWPASTPPTITVSNFSGGIWVRPSQEEVVTASVTRTSTCKNCSQLRAEDSLQLVEVDMVKEGEQIRIVTRRTDHGRVDAIMEASVEIFVPNKARLYLQTNVGSIAVSGSPMQINAENRIGIMLFDLLAADSSSKTSSSTRVRLEGGAGLAKVDRAVKGYSFSGPLKAIASKD